MRNFLVLPFLAFVFGVVQESKLDDVRADVNDNDKVGLVLNIPHDCSYCPTLEQKFAEMDSIFKVIPCYISRELSGSEAQLFYFAKGIERNDTIFPVERVMRIQIFDFFISHYVDGITKHLHPIPDEYLEMVENRKKQNEKGEPQEQRNTNADKKEKPSKKSGGKEKKASKKDQVISLKAGSFERELMADSENVWFVKFFAPWCGHCKALAPTWEDLARKMDGKVKIAEVDATIEQSLAQEFDVRGYPTLLLFPGGKKSKKNVVPYSGPRELKDLIAFVNKYAAKAIKPEQLISQVQYEEKCAEGSDLCLIAFLPNILDSNAKERRGYLKVLKEIMLEDTGLPVKFFWTEAGNSLDLERKLRLEFGWPASIIINGKKKTYAIHKGGFKKEEIIRFIGGVATGRLAADPVPDDLPVWPKMTKWDGKNAPKEDL